MIPTRIGQECHGGTFTGLNRIGNTVYGVIVAPKSTEVELKQKTSNTPTPNTQSTVDGFSNTNAMNDRVHPAAYYCKNLSINRCNDWYLPSKNELELCYRHLKPTNHLNWGFSENHFKGNLANAGGTNLSAIPIGTMYTPTSIAQTIVTQYIDNSTEAFFSSFYWSSTEWTYSTLTSIRQVFTNGNQHWNGKNRATNVRAVRRVQIV